MWIGIIIALAIPTLVIAGGLWLSAQAYLD